MRSSQQRVLYFSTTLSKNIFKKKALKKTKYICLITLVDWPNWPIRKPFYFYIASWQNFFSFPFTLFHFPTRFLLFLTRRCDKLVPKGEFAWSFVWKGLSLIFSWKAYLGFLRWGNIWQPEPYTKAYLKFKRPKFKPLKHLLYNYFTKNRFTYHLMKKVDPGVIIVTFWF